MSIILTIIDNTVRGLNRLSARLLRERAEWFTNRSGNASFRPEVIPTDFGFRAVVAHRTGCNSREWKLQQAVDVGLFPSQKRAMKEGRKVAQQLADFRYRFN